MSTNHPFFVTRYACSIALGVAMLGCGADVTDQSREGIGASSASTARGFIVVHSDFQTASVSVVSTQGELLTDRLLSSGSESAGLSQALSGDVVPSASRISGDHAVLIDRGNGVVTFVELEDAEVSQQVNVAPGFVANPHDYIPLDEETGFVLRYGHNDDADAEPFDSGSDLLVVDPSSGEIKSSISLVPAIDNSPDEFLPRATQGMLVGSKLVVLAIVQDAMFNNETSRLVIIDPDAEELERVVEVARVSNCENMSLSPDETHVALACWGDFGDLETSGIVVVDMSDGDFDQELFSAEALGDLQVNNLEFASDDVLAFTAFANSSDEDSKDTFNSLTLGTGAVEEAILETAPFNLGDVRCIPEFERCLVADAETEGGMLHHFRVMPSGELELEGTLRVEGVEPPRYLGLFCGWTPAASRRHAAPCWCSGAWLGA